MFVFWVLVAPEFIREVVLWMKVSLVFAHIIPISWLLMNFFLTESTITIGDWWHSLLLVLVYLYINYVFTIREGDPVYPFMTWNDPLTLLYSVGVWAFGEICSYICGRL